MTFKLYYTHHTFKIILDGIEEDSSLSVRDFWRSYSIVSWGYCGIFCRDQFGIQHGRTRGTGLSPSAFMDEGWSGAAFVEQAMKICYLRWKASISIRKSSQKKNWRSWERRREERGKDSFSKSFSGKKLAEILQFGKQECLNLTFEIEVTLQFRQKLTTVLQPHKDIYLAQQSKTRKASSSATL